MKKIFQTKNQIRWSLLAVFMMGAVAAHADTVSPLTPELVLMPPERVFSPPGFDNNDRAEVTITGNLPSTCYKVGPAVAEVDSVNKRIIIRNHAYYYSGCWCLMVNVPYVETVDLGVLSAANYSILVQTTPEGSFSRLGSMGIAVSANSGPDDDLYALVQEARIENGDDGKAKSLSLSGSLTSDCMVLKELKTLYRTPNVIEVLPIVELKQGLCKPHLYPFSAKVDLASTWSGETLVHIRSLNGRSLNKIAKF